MRVYLLRHGHAIAHAASDSERPLSESGRADIRANMAAVVDKLSHIDTVWVSPYLRAQQTWQEAQMFLPSAPVPIVQEAITPDGDVAVVVQMLAQAKVAKVESILIVTHQAFVGDLLDDLCAFDPGRYFIDTADIVAVDLPEVVSGVGQVLWHRKAHP